MNKQLPATMRNKIRFDACTVSDLDPTCWTWTGAATNGYGSAWYESRAWSSHKLAYTLLIGPVSDGLTIDHLCRNKLCCNPAHLEPVTNLENIRRGLAARGYTRRDELPKPRPVNDEAVDWFTKFINGGARTA